MSDRIDLAAGPDWLPVSERGRHRPARGDRHRRGSVFVGIAPAADARAYLDGVQRTVVDGLGFDAPATGSDQLPGGEPSGPPADQDFWIAQASGHGTQEVTWEPADGDWMFVVMNADGSPLVGIEARIGAEFPSLGWIGWVALIVGSALTYAAVRLLVTASAAVGPVGAVPAASGELGATPERGNTLTGVREETPTVHTVGVSSWRVDRSAPGFAAAEPALPARWRLWPCRGGVTGRMVGTRPTRGGIPMRQTGLRRRGTPPPASVVGPVAVRAAAVRALAVAAFATGAFAGGVVTLGLVNVGRLVVGRADIRRLRIGRLEVGELTVTRSLGVPVGAAVTDS